MGTYIDSLNHLFFFVQFRSYLIEKSEGERELRDLETKPEPDTYPIIAHAHTHTHPYTHVLVHTSDMSTHPDTVIGT